MIRLNIVMPAHNASKYIEQTVDSIIHQTLRDWVLYVIDDASSDNTSDLVESFCKKDSRVKLIKNVTNLRVANTMNKGIALVDSDYFARVDADDVLLPDHFQNAILFLEQNKDIAICGCQVVTIDDQSNFRRTWNYETKQDWVKMSSVFACPFLQSSVVMRTSVIKSLNGYSTDMELIEDYELWIRALTKYNGVNLPYYTIKYRIHDKNMSETNKGKIMILLKDMFQSNIDLYPIDDNNLDLHARMEFGDWRGISMGDFKNMKTWMKNLKNINIQGKFYPVQSYKDVVDKYFTNAYLKIATQNGGLVRFRALIKAITTSPKYFKEIWIRKRENAVNPYKP